MDSAGRSNKTHTVSFSGEKATLLIVLYNKAIDSRAKHPILDDTMADELVRSIDYDFSKFGKKFGDQAMTVGRAKQYDVWINEFITAHPDAVILNLGCGLDTRVFRINPPPTVAWYDLDYPEVIALRKELFPVREEYSMIASSVTDPQWMESIPSGRPTMIVAEGLLEYIPEAEVKKLFNRSTAHFHHGEMAFDVMNSFAIEMGKKNLRETTGAEHVWAVEDPREIQVMDPQLKQIADVSLADIPYLRWASWRIRIQLMLMRTSPSCRNVLRLLRYEF